MSELPKIVQEIRASAGYWRIHVRPTKYSTERVDTLLNCRKIIEEHAVSLRGWSYPHITGSAKNSMGANYFEAAVESGWRREFFRFFQSGQFIHYVGLREDNPEAKTLDRLKERSFSATRGLDITNTIWTLSEIFEFTNRLALAGILLPEIEMNITLHGTKERSLFFWDSGTELFNEYRCGVSEIPFHLTSNSDEFISKSKENALDWSIRLFSVFNWVHVERSLVQSIQNRLFERRP